MHLEIIIDPPLSNADYPHAILTELNIEHIIRFSNVIMDRIWLVEDEAGNRYGTGKELFMTFGGIHD